VDINQQKEQFSSNFVRVVAAVAGYALYKPEVDEDSIDWGIAAKGGIGSIDSPRLELQLKSTSRDVMDNHQVRYPLSLKKYNELRLNSHVPRILVLVLLPENLSDWVVQSEAELSIRHCTYWVSLRGMPETQNATTVTIELPRSNQFTVEALSTMIQRIGEGGFP